VLAGTFAVLATIPSTQLTEIGFGAAIVTVAVAMTGFLAATSQAAPARTTSSAALQWTGGTRPVIVLEHGAWADASSWDQVIAILHQEGFTVYAPPNADFRAAS
jgi:pimeloyl-ACP methyl ester carboxylesterase